MDGRGASQIRSGVARIYKLFGSASRRAGTPVLTPFHFRADNQDLPQQLAAIKNTEYRKNKASVGRRGESLAGV